MKVADYVFENKIVTYPDGHKIDLSSLNVVFVGIIYFEDKWAVSIITSNAIKKLKEGIVDNLEAISFGFNSLQDALVIQSFLTIELLAPEEKEENANKT
jgi:hypothetical protein